MPILVGAVVQTDTPGEGYNRGIVWDPVTGPGATYDKRHPLPFGEYMPYRSFFRIFSDKVDLLRGTFLPGDAAGNLDVGRRRRRRRHLLRGGLRRPGPGRRATAARRCWWCRPTTRRSATPTRPTSSRR